MSDNWKKVAVIALVVIALALVWLVICLCVNKPRARPAPTFTSWNERTECPPYWGDTAAPVVIGDSLVPLAGPYRDIPEYNDCQRLIPAGSTSYGPLAAVFGSARLLSLVADQQRAAERAGRPMAVAAATILAIDGDYAALGLARGANCLYLWKTDGGTWDARMRPVSDSGAACTQPLDVASTTGTDLDVRLSTDIPGQWPTRARAVPTVSRWERTQDGAQAIGVRCDSLWCIVGPAGFTAYSATAPVAPGAAWFTSVGGGMTPSEFVAFAQRPGWRDDQFLSSPDGSAPSTLWATIVPHPSIGEYNSFADYSTWRLSSLIWIPTPTTPAGTSTLAAYSAKFNVAAGWTAVSFCASPSAAGCATPAVELPACPLQADNYFWYALMRPEAGGGPARAFCVTRCPRSTPYVVGTARWRWVRDDETLWNRCLQGCCEVEN